MKYQSESLKFLVPTKTLENILTNTVYKLPILDANYTVTSIIAMTSNLKKPLQIDLNTEFTEGHFEDENTEFTGDFFIDLNVIPNSTDDISTTTPPLLDLNQEPSTFYEDDMDYHGDIDHDDPSEIDPSDFENEHLDDDAEDVVDESENHRQYRMLSNEERKAMYHVLLQTSDNGKLKKGTTRMVASIFSVSMRTVQRIWKRAMESGVISHRKTGNCGRKSLLMDSNAFRNTPLNDRSTLSTISKSLNISESTLSKLRKLGKIRRHSNSIKPFLKEKNKIARLRFCLSMLEHDGTTYESVFQGMYNTIHIDEKWFWMSKKRKWYYLLPDEEDPHRTIQNTNFMGKIMFLVALARPRFDPEGNEVFSGKFGVFPFVTQVPAQRRSADRAAGTLEIKPITVTRDVTRSFFIEKLLPAIKTKWPREDLRNPIYIQQDNAKPHIDEDDIKFVEAAREYGLDIRLMRQPPNSPNFNILDLGFFSAIQAIKDKESTKTYDELIAAVMKAYENYPTTNINRIFLTLQSCMIEVMKVKGCNRYKIAHMKKAMLERRGQLPERLQCDPNLVLEVLNYLENVSS